VRLQDGKNKKTMLKIIETCILLSKILALLKKMHYNTLMNTKLRKFIAITALVFMVAFLASFMVYLIDKTLLNNSILLITILTGCIAIGLYLVIVFDNKYGKEAQKKRMEEFLKEQEEANKKEQEENAKNLTEEEKLDIVKEEDKKE
jgi:uncharacterized membrane protein (DUF106 family)